MAAILIIDDEAAIAASLRKAFERGGHRVAVAASAEDGLRLAAESSPDVAFLDIRLPGMDGLAALAKLHAASPGTKTIIMTAHGNLGTAVQAVGGGAFDYLAKPFDLQQAFDAVTRATATRPGTEVPPAPIEELIGQSAAMQSVFKRIALAAPTDAAVLITGESGTGKELVARAIHAHSPRRGKPFLPVHVAALNPNLVESELFGHAKGAFTGADRSKPGLLALAHGGTIFLDELADIPLPVQAKLLRVLERREVMPVGGAASVAVDVRVVSATHADLTQAVQSGAFRHDLFYRLNVYPIHIPPLRDRLDDLESLARHFLAMNPSAPALADAALRVLQSRTWPGNVRELKNALEQAAIHARGGPIMPEHLPAPMIAAIDDTVEARLRAMTRDWVDRQFARSSAPVELDDALRSVIEPALIARVLDHVRGNRVAAARALGLARATLRKLMRKYELGDDGDDDAE